MSSDNNQSKQETDLKELFQNANLTIDEAPGTWIKLIRDKLYKMLCSHMKEDFSHEAFKWVAHLSMSLGDLSWVSPDNEWTESETKMFSCIAGLASAELHILFPLIQRHLTCGDEPDLEDGKILARSANSEDYDRFGNHLVIIESVIKSLVKGQNIDDNDDDNNGDFNQLTDSIKGEELKNLLERLKEVMTLNCDYLELVHRHWTELIGQTDSEKFASAEGALRIMCVWLSEDPGGFEPQSKRFLIDLIVKNLLLKNRPTRNDLLILALHSICTNDDSTLGRLREIPNYKEALEQYLAYVQRDHEKSGKSNERRTEKVFKLRCSLIKDLMMDTKFI